MASKPSLRKKEWIGIYLASCLDEVDLGIAAPGPPPWPPVRFSPDRAITYTSIYINFLISPCVTLLKTTISIRHVWTQAHTSSAPPWTVTATARVQMARMNAISSSPASVHYAVKKLGIVRFSLTKFN
ncbi:hypothetical protein F4779DRAFT_614063 [Xylariaceae sp. FL0662B]|nr:hypothetical protein F4779DRAFT_614063 [Xylariaceae sp. FL0662B]